MNSSGSINKTNNSGINPRVPNYSAQRQIFTYQCLASNVSYVSFKEFSPRILNVNISTNEIDIIKKGEGVLVQSHLSVTGDFTLTAEGIIFQTPLQVNDIIQIKRNALFTGSKSFPYEILRHKWLIPPVVVLPMQTPTSPTFTFTTKHSSQTLPNSAVNGDYSVTITNHNLSNSDYIIFTNGTIPPLVLNEKYYVLVLDVNTVQICAYKYIEDTFELPFILPKNKEVIPPYLVFVDGYKLSNTKPSIIVNSITSSIFNKSNHGLSQNDMVMVDLISGSLPANVAVNTLYFIQYVSDSTFRISESPSGTPITIASSTAEILVYSVCGEFYEESNSSEIVRYIKLVKPFENLTTVPKYLEFYSQGLVDYSDSYYSTIINVLKNNNLGSTYPEFDFSNPGSGIFIRRPDGTLREITLDNEDLITIKDV